MKRFFKNLKEHAIKIINYENKEMIPHQFMKDVNLITSKTFATYGKKNLAVMIKKSLLSFYW